MSVAAVAIALTATPTALGASAAELKGEEPSLATATTRAFRQDDGSIVRRIYGAPVNYRDSAGTWRHIDTDLKAQGGSLNNAGGPVDVRVPRDVSAAPLTVGPQGRAASLEPVDFAGSAKVDGDTATFSDARPGLDASFSAMASGLRQTYVLSGTDAPQRIDLDLRVSDGLTVKAQKSGGAEIVDSKGVVKYALSPTLGWAGKDASEPKPIRTTVSRASDGWRVSIDVSDNWIRKALEREAVTIDPTLTVPTASQDATFSSGFPTTTGYADALGKLYLAGGIRSTLQFDLSSVPENSRIIEAKVALHGSPTGVPDDTVQRAVTMHAVTSPWTGPETSWNTRRTGLNWGTAGGDFTSTAAATVTNARSSGGWYYWRPTALVQSWVSQQQTNNGFMLIGQSVGATDVLTTFASRNASGDDAENVPYMQVRYAPPAGQRRDDTYLSETLNDRTEMGVGVASGNLLLSSQDISINGVGLPLSLTRTYNTGLVGAQVGAFGAAGTSNISGDVRVAQLPTGDAGVYLGDGSFYRFPSNGSGGFNAAPRLEADLVRAGDLTWTLTYRRSQTKWKFDASGRLISMTDKNNNQIGLTYTGGGVLTTITDTQGRQLPVTVNNAGQITQIADPSGRTWKYSYAGTAGNRLATFTNPANQVTSYTYDGSNRLRKITTPGGRVTLVQYDADSRVASYTRVTDNAEESGPTTTLSYDQNDPRCETGESNENRTTVVTDPRGHDTTYCINDKLQVVLTVDPDGHEQATTYTPDGQVEEFSDGTGTGAAITKNTYATTTANLEKTEGPLGETTTFGQGTGTSLTEKYQPVDATDPNGTKQFFGYDGQGNVTSVGDAANPATANTKAILTYNGDGTIATAKDGENRQTTYTYWQASDGGSRKGLLKTFAPPSPRSSTTLNYDTLGRVTTATDGNSKTTTYTYDQLDRVKTVTTQGGTPFLLGETDSVITYTYDSDGNQTQRADTHGTLGGAYGYTYDALNRRTGESLPGSRSVAYAYDASSNLITLSDASGVTGYGYDALNRNCYVAPTDTGGGDCASPPSASTVMTYDERGNRTKIAYPNTVTTDITPDLSGKPTSIVTRNPSGPFASRTYTYDYGTGGASKGTQVRSTSGGKARSYTYDSSGRLASMTYDGTTDGDGTDVRVYSYDKAGNRVGSQWQATATGNAGTEQAADRTYTYNGANQLTGMGAPAGSTSFSYDGQGNDTRFTYNSRNQTSAFGSATFGYAGPNQAELTNDDGQTIENNLLGIGRRLTSSGAATRYIRASDGTLLYRQAPGNVYSIYALDIRGSVIAITDINGTPTKHFDYDPDGNLLAGSSTVEDFGYTSSYTRSGAKTLYKNGLRWYDPETARWTQPDPLDQPTDLQNANPYVYVGGDPVNFSDPLGLRPPKNRGSACERAEGPDACGDGSADLLPEEFSVVKDVLTSKGFQCASGVILFGTGAVSAYRAYRIAKSFSKLDKFNLSGGAIQTALGCG